MMESNPVLFGLLLIAVFGGSGLLAVLMARKGDRNI